MRLDFHKNHRLLFGTVLVVFIVLTLIIAVWPAWWVQTNNEPLPGSEPLNAKERKGLQVYVSEGCVYCHTQQVRPLPQDTSRYGRASAPGDYARLAPTGVWRQTPSVLGTERTGPDLANIGDRQPSASWHHIHLYQPRALVEGSVMPAFPWLYEVTNRTDSVDVVVPVPAEYAPESGKVVATEEAEALVAYLQSLRQPPLPGEGAAAEQQRGETIQGVSYPSAMPAWGDRLSHEAVAAVVNHERMSWGNDAPTITAEDGAGVREEGQPDDR